MSCSKVAAFLFSHLGIIPVLKTNLIALYNELLCSFSSINTTYSPHLHRWSKILRIQFSIKFFSHKSESKILNLFSPVYI